MKGRLQIAFVMVTCMVAILALPAVAHAVVFTSAYPVSTEAGPLHGQPNVIAVDVFDAKPIASASIVGAGAMKTFVMNDKPSLGCWKSSEELVGSVYKITWTWDSDGAVASVRKSTIYGYPATLAAGTYNVTVSATDVSGTVLPAQTWSFTIAPNGTYTPPAQEKYEGNPTCMSCHPGFETDNAMGPDCYSCHSEGFAPKHGIPNGLSGDPAFVPPALPAGAHPSPATYGDKCATSVCHTTVFADAHASVTCTNCHASSTVPDCAASGCHDDKFDAGGNVIRHGFSAAKHTASSETSDGAIPQGTVFSPFVGNAIALYVTPNYAYDTSKGTQCGGCHEMQISAQHGSDCTRCHAESGARSSFGAWNGSCSQGACHSQDPAAQHSIDMTAAHTMGAADQAAGCSPTGTGGTPVCHLSNLVIEHNRRMIYGSNGSLPTQKPSTEYASVGCKQCHESDKFKALNGAWDGTCTACHADNHSVAGTAAYASTRALHVLYCPDHNAAENVMDIHGASRVESGKQMGCSARGCHMEAHLVAGYPKTAADLGTAPASCAQFMCHQSGAPAHAGTRSPIVPTSGASMWYSGQGGGDLTLSGVTLPADSASLSFKTWYAIEKDYDFAYVEVSTDGGTSWSPVRGDISSEQSAPYGVTGFGGGWKDATFDLSAWAGRSVLLRFSLVTDSNVWWTGWFIDDVAISGPTGTVFTDDVETLKAEWAPAGEWARTGAVQ